MFFKQLQESTEVSRQSLFAVPIIIDALQGRITLAQYIAFLTQAYHHVKHTVPLLMACGSRLPEKYSDLRNAVAHYIEEEIGHEAWILQDIAACGGDPEAVRCGRPALATEVMVAYAYHQIDRGNPLAFFGMVHVLEGTSTAIASNAADVMRDQLKLPPAAFSYLTSHGSLDLEHVVFFEKLMNEMVDADDQAAIIDCANAMYRLYGDIFRSLPRPQNGAA
jgi:pyrroloquinoline quinone (PQQ) biosynthesis protein C